LIDAPLIVKRQRIIHPSPARTGHPTRIRPPAIVLPVPRQRPSARVVDPSAPATWCIDVVTLPTYIDEGKRFFRPMTVLIVDAATGLVLPTDLAATIDAPALAAAIASAQHEAPSLGLGPPRALQVERPELVALCREALGDRLPITVAPSPALDEFRTRFLEHIRSDALVGPSYAIGRTGKSLLQAFFAAGAAFRKARPWEHIDADTPIQLSIPALDLVDAAACIVTDEGTGGLMIHRDADELIARVRDRPRGMQGLEMTVIPFFERPQLPPHLASELRRLSFAPKRGPWPAIILRDRDDVSRPLAAHDVRIATAALSAIAALDLADAAGPITRTVTIVDTDYDVTIAIPHPRLVRQLH
jgi:hypothetical protein